LPAIKRLFLSARCFRAAAIRKKDGQRH
jgi:hypothetical protein